MLSGVAVVSRLYEAVGSPSYEEVRAGAQRAGHDLGIGTISNLLKGTGRPRRRTVLAFVRGCFDHSLRAKRPGLYRALPSGADNAEYWMAAWSAAVTQERVAARSMGRLQEHDSDMLAGQSDSSVHAEHGVVDPVGRELVPEWDFFIAHRDGDSAAAERLAALLRPRARVFEDSMLLPGVEWDLIGRHQRSSRVTVVLVSLLDTHSLYYRDEIATGLRLAQRDPDGHRVVPVLLAPVSVGEMPYGLMVKSSIGVNAETPMYVVADRLMDTLRAMPPRRPPGPAELAAATVDLLSAVDDHLVGKGSEHGSTVEALLAEFGDPAFTARARRHGMHPAALLPDTTQHLHAVRQWARGDDGTAAAALDCFRVDLADAIAAGRFALPSAVATGVAENLRRDAPSQSQLLDRHFGPVRSTSTEAVLARQSASGAAFASLDDRGRRLAHVARRICALPSADSRFTGRDGLLDELPYPGVVWLSGRPGTGTSALAVHWAHRIAEGFETVLYLDLFGMNPETRRSARTAARILLEAMGESVTSALREDAVLFERVGAALDRAGCLLVLDNARDAEHVAPIIRAGGPRGTVVTSRQRVQDFTADAVHVPVLDREAAVGLLAGHAPNADWDALGRIAELCDDLPLALHLAAVRLRRPDLPTNEMVRLLAAEHTRLDFLAAGDRAVRAAVLFSYWDLTPTARRAARYLSVGYGSIGDTDEMATGLGDDEPSTALALHRAVDASLADCAPSVGGPMRFQLASLVGLVMRERSAEEDAPDAVADYRRKVASHVATRLGRVVDCSGTDSELEVDPTRAHAALAAAVANSWWDTATELGTYLRAIHEADWDLEGVGTATEALVTAYLALGEPARAVSASIDAALDLRASDEHRGAALALARRGADIADTHELAGQRVRACMLCSSLAVELDDTTAALEYARRAVALSDPNSPETIRPLVNLGRLLLYRDDPADALPALRRAADLAEQVGGNKERAWAQCAMASAMIRLNHREDAEHAFGQAAVFYAAAGEPYNAAVAREDEASVQSGDGNGDAAITALTDAVAHWRAAEEPERTAAALCRLAWCVLRFREAAAEAADRLDEAGAGPNEHPDLAYEIELRKAALNRLRGRASGPPAGTPSNKVAGLSVYAAATTALTGKHDLQALLDLLSHPVVTVGETPEFWLFENQEPTARPPGLS